MKKILFLFLLFASFGVSAQVMQKPTSYGIQMRRVQADSAMRIPTVTVGIKNAYGGVDTGQIRYDISGGSVLIYTGAAWVGPVKLTGEVTSVGNAAVLGSFTSASLATALTNETGSGAAVFGTAPTFTTSITASYLTASEILITDGSKNMVSAPVATYPSLTELTYVKGLTSAIQTQMNLKAPIASPTFTGTVTMPTPFTLGAVSVLPTGTELNFVDGVTSNIQTQLDAKQGTLTNSAGLLAALSDETGSGLAVFGTAPTFTTNLTTPLIIGGTGTTSTLTYKTTTGVGATGARHIFQVGNNGATEAMTILNNGNVGIGTVSPQEKLEVNGSIIIPADASIGSLKIGLNGNAISRESGDGKLRIVSGQANIEIVPFNNTIFTQGNVGIGTTSPTAVLHLKAGTASVSPLKLTSGTLLTTPEAGAIEFLTDKFYGTITTGAARKTFVFQESPEFSGTEKHGGGSVTEFFVKQQDLGANAINVNITFPSQADANIGHFLEINFAASSGGIPTRYAAVVRYALNTINSVSATAMGTDLVGVTVANSASGMVFTSTITVNGGVTPDFIFVTARIVSAHTNAIPTGMTVN